MMQKTVAEMVNETFDVARTARPDFTHEFYRRLFEAAPDLRSIFPEDFSRQAQTLADTLEFAVTRLDRTDSLVEPLRELGRRHVSYGAKPEHYRVVVDVMVETMAGCASECWTRAHEDAWRSVLSLVSDVMQEGGDAAQQMSAQGSGASIS